MEVCASVTSTVYETESLKSLWPVFHIHTAKRTPKGLTVDGVMWEVRSLKVYVCVCDCRMFSSHVTSVNVCAHVVLLRLHCTFIKAFHLVHLSVSAFTYVGLCSQRTAINEATDPSHAYAFLLLQEFPFKSSAANPHLSGSRLLDFY